MGVLQLFVALSRGRRRARLADVPRWYVVLRPRPACSTTATTKRIPRVDDETPA